MPVALVNEWVWIMEPDTEAIVNEMAQVEHNLWDVCEHVSILIDCHEEVGDYRSWRH